MADSTHQLQDDAALDAQVAELSKDLAADAEAGGVAPIAGTPSDAEIDLDEALFAAAPTVSQLEVAAILGDESKPGVVNADASAAPTPPSPPSSPATNKQEPSAARTDPSAPRTPAEAQASSGDHDDAGFVAVSAMTAEAVDRAGQGHAAAVQSNEDESTETIDSLLNEVSEELAETAQSIEETKAAAIAIDTAQPIADSGAQAELASPETPEIITPTAAAMPATNIAATVSATGQAAIEALDTHLAANASDVLEEAERLQSAQGQAGTTGTASEASAEADADVDDSAFAPPPTENPTQAPVTAAVSTSKPETAQAHAAAPSAPAAAPANPAAVAASPDTALKPSSAPAEPRPRKPLAVRVRPIVLLAFFPIVKVSEKIPPKLLHTLGMIGVITLLNGAAFWTFRLLRSSDGAVPPSKSTVPFLHPGDEAPHSDGEHGSSDADTSDDGGAAEKPSKEDGHGATDSHGAKDDSQAQKKDSHGKGAESADSGHGAKKDSHGQAGGGHGESKAAEKPKKLSRTAKERMSALKAKDTKAPPSGSNGGGH